MGGGASYASPGWKPDAINILDSNLLKDGKHLELSIGTIQDTGYNVEVLAPFKPQLENPFLGHTNIGSEGIHLAPIEDDSARARLISVGGNIPDVRVWNWPGPHQDQGSLIV